MALERLTCGYDAATVFLALGYCLTSRHATHAAAAGKSRTRGAFACTGAARSRCCDACFAAQRSLLSIINKFAVLHFPYPAALTGFQYAVSALSVVVMCVARFRFLSRSLAPGAASRALHRRAPAQPTRQPRGGVRRGAGARALMRRA